MSIVLKTERLCFRFMRKEDFDYVLKIFSDPAVMEYYASLKSKAEVLKWMDWNFSNYRKYRTGIWVMEERESHCFIGMAGVIPLKVDGAVQMGIGYLITREKWGMGFATEAAAACKAYGFNQLGCIRLICLIDPDNTASARVAEKTGMKYEKMVRKWDKALRLYAVSSCDS